MRRIVHLKKRSTAETQRPANISYGWNKTTPDTTRYRIGLILNSNTYKDEEKSLHERKLR